MINTEEHVHNAILDLILARQLLNKDGGKFIEKTLDAATQYLKLQESSGSDIISKYEQKAKARADEIEKILSEAQNVKVSEPQGIYIDGVFDLMHVGHYNAIRQAATLGDFLVTGVIADECIRKIKGPTVLNLDERMEMLRHCKFVDKIQPQESYAVTFEIMDQHACQYFAHGDDPCFHEDGSDALATFKEANRLKIFKRTEGISTTEMTRRILELGQFQRML